MSSTHVASSDVSTDSGVANSTDTDQTGFHQFFFY